MLSLVRSSDKDLRQTGRIHPDCPCPPIAVLQLPATEAEYYTVRVLLYTVRVCARTLEFGKWEYFSIIFHIWCKLMHKHKW